MPSWPPNDRMRAKKRMRRTPLSSDVLGMDIDLAWDQKDMLWRWRAEKSEQGNDEADG